MSNKIKNPSWPFPISNPLVTFDNYFESVSITEDEDVLEKVRILHVNRHSMGSGMHSYTVAYRPCTTFKSGNMVEFAVAVCCPNDQFNKRIGKELAEARFNNGQTVTLPIKEEGSLASINNYFWEMLP